MFTVFLSSFIACLFVCFECFVQTLLTLVFNWELLKNIIDQCLMKSCSILCREISCLMSKTGRVFRSFFCFQNIAPLFTAPLGYLIKKTVEWAEFRVERNPVTYLNKHFLRICLDSFRWGISDSIVFNVPSLIHKKSASSHVTQIPLFPTNRPFGSWPHVLKRLIYGKDVVFRRVRGFKPNKFVSFFSSLIYTSDFRFVH